MKKDKFTDGQIIRLICNSDFEEIPKGTLGCIWGVYDMKPTVYEATFYSKEGEEFYYIFREEEVELSSLEEVKDPNLIKWYNEFFE